MAFEFLHSQLFTVPRLGEIALQDRTIQLEYMERINMTNMI